MPLQKWLTLVGRLHQPFTRSAPRRAPTVQGGSARNLTREHRTGPHSSRTAGFHPPNNLNRVGSASPLSQPVLRCKRRSQLSQYPTPVSPYVLTRFLAGTVEGDMYAIADKGHPSARDSLGATEQAVGASTRAAAWCTVSPYFP